MAFKPFIVWKSSPPKPSAPAGAGPMPRDADALFEWARRNILDPPDAAMRSDLDERRDICVQAFALAQRADTIGLSTAAYLLDLAGLDAGRMFGLQECLRSLRRENTPGRDP